MFLSLSYLQRSPGMGHYFFASVPSTVGTCYPLKTFCSLLCLLALITVTSVCHIWSPGGAEVPEAVSILYVRIPYVGKGELSLPLRWGSSWLGLLLVSVVTSILRDMENFQMPISHSQTVDFPSLISCALVLLVWKLSVYPKQELLWWGELPALGCLCLGAALWLRSKRGRSFLADCFALWCKESLHFL